MSSMPASEPLIIVDGSVDFSGGVDSTKVTTIASDINPNGLQRNETAWLENATVRDGGISPRPGWQPIGFMHAGNALYQGGFMYSPVGDFPYLIHAIGGILYRQDMTSGALTPLSTDPTLYHPSHIDQFFFVQAEEFLIVQAGDGATLPLFWDGVTLRRSNGITGVVAPGPGVNEIPAATAMDYFMGRVWYAQNRTVSAGDIVGGSSGTIAYNFRDAVLKVTENPMALGGDGFTVPSQDGAVIRGVAHSANIDAALGQGRLFMFTSKAVYGLNVPVTRADWIAADTDNQPLMTVVQLVNGAVNDRSIVPANGDLFFQSLEPGIRSLLQAVRYFSQWGNVEISSNEQRVLQFNDRSLLKGASGIVFDNRLLQTALPFQSPVGIAHKALIPMDFIPISSFNRQKEPNWEGVHSGLDFLQLFTGDFGGRERAFAAIVSRDDGSINLWELTSTSKTENADGRITWKVEFPAFNWGKPFDLKKLVTAELWIDRLTGTVEFTLEYKPDGQTCALPWHRWQACAPRTSAEDCENPVAYPLTQYGPCYISTMTMPKPPESCAACNTGRPANIAYQIQPILTVKGYCRLRGILLHAEPYMRKLYANIAC